MSFVVKTETLSTVCDWRRGVALLGRHDIPSAACKLYIHAVGLMSQ